MRHFWFCPTVMYPNERQLKCRCKEQKMGTLNHKILGTIDVQQEVYCLNCDRGKGVAKKIYPGGRMSLVKVDGLNSYEPWCMECSLPLLNEEAHRLTHKILGKNAEKK